MQHLIYKPLLEPERRKTSMLVGLLSGTYAVLEAGLRVPFSAACSSTAHPCSCEGYSGTVKESVCATV